MNILVFSNSYPPLKGGLQIATQSLAHEWQQNGHEVQVLANQYPRWLLRREKLNGIDVRRELFLSPNLDFIRNGRTDLWLAGIIMQPVVSFRLWQLFKHFRPQVVNVHFPDAQIPFVLWLRKVFTFRLVVSFHGDDVLRWLDANAQDISPALQNSQKLQKLRLLLKQADVITACSNYLLSKVCLLDACVQKKGFTIHNGVDFESFQRKEFHLHPRSYFLAYGRLVHRKGFDLLISAFSRLANLHPDLDLILAGDGPSREELLTQIHRLGLRKRVHLFGSASQEQVSALLNGSKFVAIPSRNEPFGIVALEAMAAGKTLLATAVGGLPEFVPETDNCLVSPIEDGLFEGLRQILLTDLETTGAANRRAASYFSWQSAAGQYLQFFH